MKKKELKYSLIIISLIIFDMVTKVIFTNKSFFKENLIYITYSKNFGSSFGIFSNFSYYSYFIIILATICIFAIFHYRKQLLKNQFLIIATIFFISGVIGNTIDRVLFGYVRDFIGIKYLFIFNLADLYITIAFIFYILYEIDEYKVTTKNKTKAV